MKKHQVFAIVGIIILAVVAGTFIFASKKSTEPAPQDTTPTTTDMTPSAGGTTSAPHETTNPNPPSTTPTSTTGATTYTMAQVATHNSRTSCYTVISGSVYDLTSWIGQHPGGQFAILGLCGKDGTTSFNDQHGGQARPESELASFKIGTLVQ